MLIGAVICCTRSKLPVQTIVFAVIIGRWVQTIFEVVVLHEKNVATVLLPLANTCCMANHSYSLTLYPRWQHIPRTAQILVTTVTILRLQSVGLARGASRVKLTLFYNIFAYFHNSLHIIEHGCSQHGVCIASYSRGRRWEERRWREMFVEFFARTVRTDGT